MSLDPCVNTAINSLRDELGRKIDEYRIELKFHLNWIFYMLAAVALSIFCGSLLLAVVLTMGFKRLVVE